MNRIDLLNLLAAHADRLNTGGDDAGLLASHAEAAAVWPFFVLARAVKEALVPVQPRDTFRRDLGYQLLAADISPNRPWHTGLWWRAALLGSLLSVAGVLLLFLRYNRVFLLDTGKRL